MARDFSLPDLGEGIAEAQVIRVLVSPGETIAEDQYLMEVETDKAAVEIPSPFAGVAEKVLVEEGQTINVGDVIVTFDGEGSGAAKKAKAGSAKQAATLEAPKTSGNAASATAVSTDAPPTATNTGRTKSAAAPAVRKLAREAGVALDSIAGTGPGGRITRDDVERHLGNQATAPATVFDASANACSAQTAPIPAPRPISTPMAPPPGVVGQDKWGTVRKAPLSQIRKTIASQMSRSAFTAVHVTHCDEADITELDRLRRSLNEATGNDPKLTAMSFLVRAVCLSLRKHPHFNASFDDEGGQMIYKDYVNVGIAVDTERGLIVPVVRNADQLSLRGIALALRSIADRIRANQFAIEDLRGGTFTITNVGALGGTVNTPIINFPEVAILGLGRSRKVPVLRDGSLAESLILPLNLSFDHRAVDGANAARFTREIMSYLETPTRFMLD